MIFELVVIIPTLVGGALLVLRHIDLFRWPLVGELILWALAVALVEIIPVPAWRGIHLSLSFPLLMALAMVHDPVVAGVTAFVGSVRSASSGTR